MSERYVGCSVRRLPPHKAVEAARTAIKINPANAPVIPPSLAPIPQERIALLTSKYWGPKGVNLTVQFLDGPDQPTRSKILSHMNAWGKTANVTFAETQGQGQVRIARQQGQGYWSYLGTDILSIPAGQPTMNLEGFTAQGTPDSEFFRVVRHETGHTLGFPHEHLRKEIVQRLDPQKTIAYFQQNDGWDAQTTTEQVLTPLVDSDLTALPTDVLSIMTYSLPAEITIDGRGIPGGTDIDEEDYSLAAKLYPKSDTGGGGGGGGGGKPAGSRVFGLTFGQNVTQGQRVRIPVFAAPAAIPAGKYSVVADAPAGSQEEGAVAEATAHL